MSDKFEWGADNPDIVQHSVQGVAVFINQYGDISVIQERNWDEDEDTCIRLTFSGARELSEKLKELIQAKS